MGHSNISTEKKLIEKSVMNKLLANLYSSKWDKLQIEICKINSDNELKTKPTNPLLLVVDNEEIYQSADIKIMIFGQETNGWYEEDNTIEGIFNGYDTFFNNGKCYKYGGQFWNGFNRFIQSLQHKYPDKTIKPIWNNIVKIGCSDRKGFPPNYIYDIEKQCFSVIKEEIEILKPNIILFFTGPNYDRIISDIFGELPYKALTPFSERQISRVQLDSVPFAFRTYHPNYLWRNEIDKYFDRIIEEIEL